MRILALNLASEIVLWLPIFNLDRNANRRSD